MKKSNGILFPIIFSSIFALTACGGGAGGADTTTDTDADGLTDADEINLYHTNPDVADTDGDGYSDHEEIINKNFDATNSNYRFNPLIADVPKLDVSIGVPNFSVTYSTSTSTDNSFATGYENSVSTDSSQTNGGSSSHSIARSFSAEVSIESTVSFTPEVKAGLKLTSGFVDTESDETNYSSTLQQHNGQTYSSLQTLSNTSGTTIDSAAMALFVSVDNPGHVAYTLNDLSLSVSMAGNNASGYGIPIGTLTRAAGASTIPLAVAGTPTEEVYTLQMSLQNYDTLIQNYSNLVISPVVGENNLGSDSSETNWVNLSDDVAARTATVSIDYGPVKEPETYRVATSLTINSQSLTLGNILTDILKIPYSVQNNELTPVGASAPVASSNLASMRGITMDIANNKMWFVAHEHTAATGVGTVTDIYTPRVIQDVESLVIKAGDGVRFVYVKDSDSDKLTDREEFMLGTDPNDSDTDGDTILDGDEVNGYAVSNGTVYTSNPALADSDADGLTDFEEIALSTDPANPDTDGDGGSDSFEVSIGNSPTSDNSTEYATDSDGDKLTDIEEQYITFTDATKADTDGDGLSDSFELGRVSNIFSAANPVVADCVSTYNAAIIALNSPVYDAYKLNPDNTNRCDPTLADTDADGINDGAEIAGWVVGYQGAGLLVPSNPFIADTDADGLNDKQENLKTGNPLSKDTDADGVDDGAEIASIHNRSVIKPEVIVASSIKTIQTNNCTGSFSGLFGFKEKQAADFGPLLAQYKTTPTLYLDISGMLQLPSYWSNFLSVLNIAGPATTLHADAGYTNGLDSGGGFQGGTGVEFVTDDGNYHSSEPGTAPYPSIYNSDWFAISNEDPDLGARAMEKSFLYMTKEILYHPQKVKIEQGQTLKAWSNNLCYVSPTSTANSYFRVGYFFSQNVNGAVPMECPTSSVSQPFNKLTKEWTYSQFVDPDGSDPQPAPYETASQTETVFVKNQSCSFKFNYDLKVVQE